MKSIAQSLGHALSGLVEAVKTERNIKLFLCGYCVVLALSFYCKLTANEWLWIIVAGGMFLSIELLNTALEHLADILDESKESPKDPAYHSAMKAAKDIASSASLVSLIASGTIIVIIFAPHFFRFV